MASITNQHRFILRVPESGDIPRSTPGRNRDSHARAEAGRVPCGLGSRPQTRTAPITSSTYTAVISGSICDAGSRSSVAKRLQLFQRARLGDSNSALFLQMRRIP